MKNIFLLFFSLIAIPFFAQDGLPLPNEAQLAWQNSELVAVFHYDLHVFDGKKYVQRNNRVTPIEDRNIMNPTELDTDQWAKSAKDMGAKIAIFTATHETGFANFQSEANPYSLKSVDWRNGKGDIVKDFVESCRKYGIEPGIYIGIRWNSYYGIHDFKVEGDSQFAKNRQEHYNKLCEGMVEELTANYGDLAIIWFDGGAHGPEQGGPDVLSIVEKNQPNAIFFHNLDRADIRWGGSESGTVPYPCWGTYNYPSWFANRGDEDNFRPIKHGFPDGDYYMPAMSDAPLRGYNGRHEWFWEPNDEDHVYPLENLMNMYYKSVGRNSSLIMGIAPNDKGLVPEVDAKRMKEFGDEVKRIFATPIAETSGDGFSFQLKVKNEINNIVIEEDIQFGERVREFKVEVQTNKGWQTLFEGSSIGHKHIIKLEETLDVKKVRLQITKSVFEPKIKRFSVY